MVHRLAVGSLIFQSPEIEAPHAVGAESFRHRNTAVEDFALLLKSKIGVELITLWTEL